MASSRITITNDLVSSQWVWLDDVVDSISRATQRSEQDTKQLLLTHSIDRVYPTLLDRSGSQSICSDEASTQAERVSLIRYQLGESINHHTVKTVHAAQYSHIAFSLVALRNWMTTCKFGPKISEWETWMKTTYPILKLRGLLFEETNKKTTDNNQSNFSWSGSTICFAELQSITGYKSPSEISAWLTSNNIPYKIGLRNRPFTTADALNQSLGVQNRSGPEKRVISV